MFVARHLLLLLSSIEKVHPLSAYNPYSFLLYIVETSLRLGTFVTTCHIPDYELRREPTTTTVSNISSRWFQEEQLVWGTRRAKSSTTCRVVAYHGIVKSLGHISYLHLFFSEEYVRRSIEEARSFSDNNPPASPLPSVLLSPLQTRYSVNKKVVEEVDMPFPIDAEGVPGRTKMRGRRVQRLPRPEGELEDNNKEEDGWELDSEAAGGGVL